MKLAGVFFLTVIYHLCFVSGGSLLDDVIPVPGTSTQSSRQDQGPGASSGGEGAGGVGIAVYTTVPGEPPKNIVLKLNDRIHPEGLIVDEDGDDKSFTKVFTVKESFGIVKVWGGTAIIWQKGTDEVKCNRVLAHFLNKSPVFVTIYLEENQGESVSKTFSIKGAKWIPYEDAKIMKNITIESLNKDSDPLPAVPKVTKPALIARPFLKDDILVGDMKYVSNYDESTFRKFKTSTLNFANVNKRLFDVISTDEKSSAFMITPMPNSTLEKIVEGTKKVWKPSSGDRCVKIWYYPQTKLGSLVRLLIANSNKLYSQILVKYNEEWSSIGLNIYYAAMYDVEVATVTCDPSRKELLSQYFIADGRQYGVPYRVFMPYLRVKVTRVRYCCSELWVAKPHIESCTSILMDYEETPSSIAITVVGLNGLKNLFFVRSGAEWKHVTEWEYPEKYKLHHFNNISTPGTHNTFRVKLESENTVYDVTMQPEVVKRTRIIKASAPKLQASNVMVQPTNATERSIMPKFDTELDLKEISHPNVSIEYDGDYKDFTATFTSQESIRIIKIVDGKYNVWEAKDGEFCFKVVANYLKSTPLSATIYITNKQGGVISKFLSVRGSRWIPVEDHKKFLKRGNAITKCKASTLAEEIGILLKSNCPLNDGCFLGTKSSTICSCGKGGVTLDLGDMNNSNFHLTWNNNDGVKVYRMVPDRNSWINKIVEGSADVWKAGKGDRCASASITLKPDFNPLMKLLIANSGSFYHKSFVKLEGKWYNIDFGLYHSIRERYNGREATFDINNRTWSPHYNIVDGRLYGVPYKLFIMLVTVKVNKIIDGSNIVWKASEGEYCIDIATDYGRYPAIISLTILSSTGAQGVVFVKRGRNWKQCGENSPKKYMLYTYEDDVDSERITLVKENLNAPSTSKGPQPPSNLKDGKHYDFMRYCRSGLCTSNFVVTKYATGHLCSYECIPRPNTPTTMLSYGCDVIWKQSDPKEQCTKAVVHVLSVFPELAEVTVSKKSNDKNPSVITLERKDGQWTKVNKDVYDRALATAKAIDPETLKPVYLSNLSAQLADCNFDLCGANKHFFNRCKSSCGKLISEKYTPETGLNVPMLFFSREPVWVSFSSGFSLKEATFHFEERTPRLVCLGINGPNKELCHHYRNVNKVWMPINEEEYDRTLAEIKGKVYISGPRDVELDITDIDEDIFSVEESKEGGLVKKTFSTKNCHRLTEVYELNIPVWKGQQGEFCSLFTLYLDNKSPVSVALDYTDANDRTHHKHYKKQDGKWVEDTNNDHGLSGELESSKPPAQPAPGGSVQPQVVNAKPANGKQK